MSKRPLIVAWQPVLTDHQAYTLEALGNSADADLMTVAVRHNQAERVQQGWQPLGLTKLNPTILSRTKWIGEIAGLLRSRSDTVHLFCGPFGDLRITLALLAALAWRKTVYVVSEPYSPLATGYLEDGNRYIAALKAKLRPFVYSVFGMALRKRVTGVFAISRLANLQYRKMGISGRAIFPFGYFVPTPDAASPGPPQLGHETRAGLRLCFVASLILRKGLHKLVQAAHTAAATGAALSVDVYGSGDPSKYDFDGDTVTYCGVIPFGTAGAVMASYDALVIPSEHDGWGVVVNEALSAGVPVIVSKNVGASAMVEKFGCGIVYDPQKPDALQEALMLLAARPDHLAELRNATQVLKPLLEPDVAGRYMKDVIFGDSMPPCPWYDYP
jgi:glycosyltransferase involved in cell wall biosynthesis